MDEKSKHVPRTKVKHNEEQLDHDKFYVPDPKEK